MYGWQVLDEKGLWLIYTERPTYSPKISCPPKSYDTLMVSIVLSDLLIHTQLILIVCCPGPRIVPQNGDRLLNKRVLIFKELTVARDKYANLVVRNVANARKMEVVLWGTQDYPTESYTVKDSFSNSLTSNLRPKG